MLAVAPDGTIAYATDEGALGITTSLDDLGEAPAARSGRVVAAAFAPGEATMVIEVEDVDGEPAARARRPRRGEADAAGPRRVAPALAALS